MSAEMRKPPTYAITSVDHALRIATLLQLEGSITVSGAAERLGVARSTAHRLLTMLVYRDFAVQDAGRGYRAGPVLELAAISHSLTARLRAAALQPLRILADTFDETANVLVRTGDTVRFIASAEGSQPLRVGDREGMVFPAHRTTAGLLLLAELDPADLEAIYAPERFADRPAERPDMARLRRDLDRTRRTGQVVNEGRSERGVVAVGRLVRDAAGVALGAVSISMPSIRYQPPDLPRYDAALRSASAAIEAGLI